MSNLSKEFEEKTYDERLEYWTMYVFNGLIKEGTNGFKRNLSLALQREIEYAFERGQLSMEEYQ